MQHICFLFELTIFFYSATVEETSNEDSKDNIISCENKLG